MANCWNIIINSDEIRDNKNIPHTLKSEYGKTLWYRYRVYIFFFACVFPAFWLFAHFYNLKHFFRVTQQKQKLR